MTIPLLWAALLCVQLEGSTAHATETQRALTFQPVAGTVVPMGGSVRNDNEAVRQRLVQLAGGSAAHFVVIPSASSHPETSGADAVEQLRRRGAQAELLKIAPRWAGETLESARRAANDPANVAKIRTATGVFFTGGDQGRTADVLNPDGVATPVLQAVRALQARGGVIAGSSAGAAIMSSTMFRDAMNSVQVMKGVMRDGKEIDRGLGFVGDQLFIDQHFLKRGRVGRMLALMLAKGYKVGLGVDENTAAIIHGSEIEIVGGSGALLLDLRQATQEAGPVNVRNVRISYLDNGDRYDLAKLKGQVLAAKQARGEIKFRQPGFASELEFIRPAFTDILGENTILRALTQLVDGPRDHVRGIAFDLEQLADAPVADPAPELGFEFMLRRDEHTHGWDSAGLDDKDYSIFDARLDVRPVRLKAPFYQAWQ
jgi:cyanophycinase